MGQAVFPARRGSRSPVRKYWNVLREMSIAEYRLKDQSTFFGFLWSFFHPLLVVLVLYAFFRLRVGEGIANYPIYLLIGIVHFTHFSSSTSSAMTVLHGMRQLTCNVILPKEVLVIGSVLSKLPELAFSMILCVIIAGLAGAPLGWGVLLLPLVFVLQFLLVLWVSLALSTLYVFVRDAAYVYQVFLRVLFFITPTFYSLSFVGEGTARSIVLMNPLAHVMDFSRLAILGGAFPFARLLAFLAVNLVLVWLSLAVFRRQEPRFAEHV
jgi:ABC-type polysaccharide/polyol phosphate export permease